MTFSSRLTMLAANSDVKLLSTALGFGCRIHPVVPENLHLLFLQANFHSSVSLPALSPC